MSMIERIRTLRAKIYNLWGTNVHMGGKFTMGPDLDGGGGEHC